MTKLTFFDILSARLSALPAKELEKLLSFYRESLQERLEDGMDEEQAVASLGDPEQIARELLDDLPPAMRPQKKRMSGMTIILLVLGSPLWLCFLAVALSLLVTLYCLVLSVIITLYAVLVSLSLTGLALVIGGVLFVIQTHILAGMFCAGMGLACFGGFLLLTKPIWWVCRAMVRWMGLPFKKVAQHFRKDQEVL